MQFFSFFKRKNQRSGIQSGSKAQDESLILSLHSQISELHAEITKNHRLTESLISNAVAEQFDVVLEGLSQSAVYMATQLSLVHQNNNISATDLAATIQLFLTSVEQLGAQFIGEPGQVVPYDAESHSASHPNLEVGAQVVIQVPGLRSPSGKVLRQAMVIKQ
jgi:hypothetical protein